MSTPSLERQRPAALPEKESPRATGSKRPALIGAAVALVAVAAGAWFFFGGSHAAPKAAAAAPFPVVVQTVAEKKLRLWSDFSGRLHAVDSAEIRPQVAGKITEVRFEDGQAVKAGDILFVIDPRPYEAAVAQAEARVASAKADFEFSKADHQRATGLLASHAIAQREFDQADNAHGVAVSTLAAAEAELQTARLNLDYAYVKAPIAGRVSRAEITVGNLVQSTPNAPLLTTIVSEDGIYADFEVDEQTYMETIRDAAAGNAQEHLVPVRLVVPGDRGHVYEGFIESFDNRIDSASGTIRARAKFANADQALVPGMFVTVRLAGSQEHTALLIPERAIAADQSKKFVFVVDASGKVAYRAIELGRAVREQRVVEKGLQPGDRVIVDGIQHVRPGAAVAATEAPAPSDDAAATALAQENAPKR